MTEDKDVLPSDAEGGSLKPLPKDATPKKDKTGSSEEKKVEEDPSEQPS